MNLLQFRVIPLFFAILLSHHSYVLADFVYGISYSIFYEVDTSSNTLTDIVGVGGQELAMSPDGNFIYVVDAANDIFRVVNRCSKSVIATIPVGNTPGGLAITPDGLFAYVANTSDWTVSVINLTTLKVVGNPIQVGSLPTNIAITPNGLYAYVTHISSNYICVIDTRTNTVIKTINTPETTTDDIAITPDGLFAYSVSGTNGTISVINTTTNTIIKTISGFTRPGKIAITPNGLFAYVANGTNVAVVSTASNSIVKTISTPMSDLNSITITPNGSQVYVGSSYDSNVCYINTSTNTVQGTVSAFSSTSMASTNLDVLLKTKANPASPSICSGQQAYVNLLSNIPNTTFAWTVVQNNVSGASNGVGNYIQQVLTATSSVPGTAVYTIRSSATGCSGTIYRGDPLIVTVKVNPKPVATATPSQLTISSGSTTNIVLTSTIPGTIFSWSAVGTYALGSSNGSGTAIQQKLTTSFNSPGFVTYTVTPSFNGCNGSPIKIVVTVNP